MAATIKFKPLKSLFLLSGLLLSMGSMPSISYAQIPSEFVTPAKNLIVMDFESGEILFEKDARAPMPPASMTKIMTASVVFDLINHGALTMDQKFTVSENAWRKGGVKSGSSTMFLKPKSEVSVRDLLYGVIIQSGNDACITLAEGIAGSEAGFAEMMNAKARDLGLTSAVFKNATGWPDEGHVISAYDLAKLAHHSISAYPELYKIYAEESFTWNGIKQPNRNPLIMAGMKGADGLKTGHTTISKYGFVGSSVRGDTRRLFVVNGLQSKSQRRSESIRIMKAAFDQFGVYSLYKSDDIAGQAPVYMGKSSHVKLQVKQDVNIGMAKILRPNMNAKIRYQTPLAAPIQKGDHVADLLINVSGQEKKIIPLYAEQAVERKSAVARILAAMLNKIRGQ